MSFFEFPYTRTYSSDLGWIIRQLDWVTKEVQFKTIKYADPLAWDITQQYEQNTVVIDQNTGIAYLSTKPVPSGVSISNTDYWTVIFDLQQIIGSINENLTYHNDGTSPTCTMSLDVNDWVLWQGKLYKVLVPMSPGYAYIPDSNIEAHSVEELVKEYIQAIYSYVGLLSDLATTDKSSVVNAINEVLTGLSALIGDLNDLATTDKSSVVNAINEVLTGLSALIGDLNDLATTDKSSVVNAINEVISTFGAIIGDLNDLATTDKSSVVNAINNIMALIGDLNNLATTDKSSIVNAINEVYNQPKGVIINVKDHGAVGDGVTNDYNAIMAAINHAGSEGLSIIYFPDGEYYCGNGKFTLDSSHIEFMGAANSKLISSGLSSSDVFIEIVSTFSLGQYDYPRKPISKLCIQGNYFTDTSSTGTIGVKMGTDTTYMSPHSILENVVIRNFAIGLELSSAYKTTYLNCSFIANNRGVAIPSDGVQQAVPCTFISCWFECNNYALVGSSGGYNNLTFLGGAFEYNRSVFTTYTKLVFVGVRFEYDAHASCDPALNIRPVFNGAALAGSHTVEKFIGCFFLELNNFESNVTYWITNPYKASTYNTSRIYCVGGGKVSIECTMCEFESVNDIPAGAGYYYISTDKYYGYGNYTNSITVANMVDPNYVVQSGNGFII
ncbi:MAG: glycosyl hydrolase family 28-related protein [Ruminococcus sp.]|nr:glycosyl hydrolase family 28-related protein [Ruminococcus sp.]